VSEQHPPERERAREIAKRIVGSGYTTGSEREALARAYLALASENERLEQRETALREALQEIRFGLWGDMTPSEILRIHRQISERALAAQQPPEQAAEES
jgi:hypothetical protein